MNKRWIVGFAQRVVVITGASSGFGADIARQAVAQGARVVLAARSTAKLNALVAELGGAVHAIAVTADVTSDSQRLWDR